MMSDRKAAVWVYWVGIVYFLIIGILYLLGGLGLIHIHDVVDNVRTVTLCGLVGILLAFYCLEQLRKKRESEKTKSFDTDDTPTPEEEQ